MAYSAASEVSIGPEQVGIAVTHGTLGSHLGIAFPGRDGVIVLLDLAWHKRLRCDFYPQPNWIASALQIGPLAAVQLIALLRGMAQRYGNQPLLQENLDYGINLFAGRDAVRANGIYKPGKNCDGYTCSSLIAEVLRKVGFLLVNLKTWPSSPENQAWANAIVCLLTASQDVPKDHVDRVKANINGTRLRPEEVAAAAELPWRERPAAHGVVQFRAKEIMEQMLATCGPVPPMRPEFQACCDAYRVELEALQIGKDLLSNARPEGSSLDLAEKEFRGADVSVAERKYNIILGDRVRDADDLSGPSVS